MLLENAFKCSFKDCFLTCCITAIITLIILILVHAYMYYRLAKVAENRYGDQPLIVHQKL